jgi:hypothetical protein
VILKQPMCVLCVLSFLGASPGLASARDQERGWKMVPAPSGMQTCRKQTPQEAAKSRAVKRWIKNGAKSRRYYR